jgi:hypothetical protein
MRDEPGTPLAPTGIDAGGRLPKKDSLTFRGDAVAQKLIAGVVKNGWAPSGRQIAAFDRTVRALRAEGVEVMVIDMAISQPMIDLLGKDGYDAYRAFIREHAGDLEVPVLDMAGGVEHTRYFIDFDHVNRAGANVFNVALARALGGDAGAFDRRLPPRVRTEPVSKVLAADAIDREIARAAATAPEVPAPSAAPIPSVAPSAVPTPGIVQPVPTPTIKVPVPTPLASIRP